MSVDGPTPAVLAELWAEFYAAAADYREAVQAEAEGRLGPVAARRRKRAAQERVRPIRRALRAAGVPLRDLR